MTAQEGKSRYGISPFSFQIQGKVKHVTICRGKKEEKSQSGKYGITSLLSLSNVWKLRDKEEEEKGLNIPNKAKRSTRV